MLRRAFSQVDGPKQDLHSGVYGGAVIEPMTDLIGILGECFSKRDNVQSLSPSQKGKTQTKEQLGLGNMPGNVSIWLNLKSWWIHLFESEAAWPECPETFNH